MTHKPLVMPYSQYCRIESAAGGTSASPRQFIKAARQLLSPLGRSRQQRTARHQWLRSGLQLLADAKQLRRQFAI